MSEYVTLMGSEDVSRAGYAMKSAAEEMKHAASSFDQSCREQRQFMEDWLTRFEQVMTAHPEHAERNDVMEWTNENDWNLHRLRRSDKARSILPTPDAAPLKQRLAQSRRDADGEDADGESENGKLCQLTESLWKIQLSRNPWQLRRMAKAIPRSFTAFL
jgi:hypothetical protein